MNFGVKRGERVEVNLTPLIDVVFLLLIFFMVTTTFDRYSELKVNLPQSSNNPEFQQHDKLEIVIDAEGKYYVNGQLLINTQAQTLRSALQKVTDGKKDLQVVIRADAKTPHESVVTAMDSAARLGLTQLSIATSQSGEDQ